MGVSRGRKSCGPADEILCLGVDLRSCDTWDLKAEAPQGVVVVARVGV